MANQINNEVITENQYKLAIRKTLDSYGYNETKVFIKGVTSVDLDQDGSKEDIVIAETTINKKGYPGLTSFGQKAKKSGTSV